MKKRVRSVVCLLLCALVFLESSGNVQAVTIEELQRQIQESQSYLNSENATISGLQDEQDLIEEEIEDTEAELVNLYTEIGVLEDQIAEKESSIAEKEAEIEVAQAEYEEAEAEERRQYEAMKERIRFTYEQGESSYIELLLSSGSFSELLNRAEFIEEVSAYDDRMLEEYQAIKQKVADLKAKLEADRQILVEEKEALEADKATLAKQQSYLNGILAQKKAVSANYDAEIAEAKNRAAQYKQQIAADTKKIQQIQEEERRRLAEQNSSGGGTKNTKPNPNAANTIAAAQAIVAQSGGSSNGKSIANYACQFIGNPYVSGGTSLTNGADCSGFIYALYKDYGYRVPRTSWQLREVGTGVSYSEAQPGDIVCYEGHVGMYIGGGMIVHASTQRTGIKVSNAQYRPILTVRRVM
ncbi:NlpC/P60 family protein [Lachnospiraceae bacterium 38-10]